MHDPFTFFKSSSDLDISSKSHPESAKALAVALPIPLEAPVINTVDKKIKGELYNFKLKVDYQSVETLNIFQFF